MFCGDVAMMRKFRKNVSNQLIDVGHVIVIAYHNHCRLSTIEHLSCGRPSSK